MKVEISAFRFLLSVFCLGLLVSLCAINNQSLWIDEALTAVKAQQPTLAGWWQAMVGEKASDLQMPLYMLYVWGYEKVFGSSEWVLRSANAPWFVLGMAAFIAALSSSKQRTIAAALAPWSSGRSGVLGGPGGYSTGLVTALSPFAWYYLNEARPYTMQLGASLIVFAALYRLLGKPVLNAAGEQLWVIGFCFGIVVLCASSMLGMIWAASAVAIAAVISSPQRIAELWRSYRYGWLSTACFVLLLSFYYLWTLKVGARASGVASTDWKNIFFIGYELSGFGGLGPGRLEIRESGLGVFQRHWLKLALYGVSVLVLTVAAIRQLLCTNERSPRGVALFTASLASSLFTPRGKLVLKLTLTVAAPAVVLVAAGLAMHFRVLGRHFTPLMPVVLFLLTSGVVALWSQRSLFSKLVVSGFCFLSLVSCLSLRFEARHERDNYRDAAAHARAALQRGQSVWWNAAGEGADYYQVATTTQPNETNQALSVINATGDFLSTLPLPQVIISSKPDIFDNQGAVAEYVKRAGYRKVATLPAFTIWQRTGPVE